jgi:hypothetical protein
MLTWTAVATADDYKRHITPAGRTAARGVVLTRADIGQAPGWKGGFVKPDTSPDPDCPNFDPKVSDLVITGEAAADWTHAGVNLHSESAVLQTAKMAQLDWQRSTGPGELECARSYFTKISTASARFISVKRLTFPKIARRMETFRVLIDITGASREIIRMATDVVFVGVGRTEITLLTTVPLTSTATIAPIEVALAKKLIARVRA